MSTYTIFPDDMSVLAYLRSFGKEWVVIYPQGDLERVKWVRLLDEGVLWIFAEGDEGYQTTPIGLVDHNGVIFDY